MEKCLLVNEVALHPLGLLVQTVLRVLELAAARRRHEVELPEAVVQLALKVRTCLVERERIGGGVVPLRQDAKPGKTVGSERERPVEVLEAASVVRRSRDLRVRIDHVPSPEKKDRRKRVRRFRVRLELREAESIRLVRDGRVAIGPLAAEEKEIREWIRHLPREPQLVELIEEMVLDVAGRKDLVGEDRATREVLRVGATDHRQPRGQCEPEEPVCRPPPREPLPLTGSPRGHASPSIARGMRTAQTKRRRARSGRTEKYPAHRIRPAR
jgi:hypothetical protein